MGFGQDVARRLRRAASFPTGGRSAAKLSFSGSHGRQPCAGAETVTQLVANARMYAVTEVAAAGWRSIFRWLAQRSGVELALLDHPPPAPLNDLWRRPDLGCAFICGWPFARAEPRPKLLAAPIPSPARYGGEPIYFSDIVVRRDAPFRSLEDTFGGVVGWTLEDSHSGFNALRNHLLAYRQASKSTLYGKSVGGLVNPLGALKAIAEGRVDVAPIDSFCHDLLRAHGHPVTERVRTIATTAPSPIPVLVAAAEVPDEIAEALSAALLDAHRGPAIAPALEDVLVRRFVRPDPARYGHGEELARAAAAAGYPIPA
jgi:ABC-type phosphate/phosphonate transport system substrate-binding protein